MHSLSAQLSSAVEYAETFRFSGECLALATEEVPGDGLSVRDYFYHSGLEITQQVTPYIFASVSRVCEKLKMPSDSFEAFVFASAELQAECYSGGHLDCTLRFSSALIDLLDDNELDFVVGHELGHFLLRHPSTRNNFNREGYEDYIQQRYQEISADRLGLIACGNLEAAIRALLKTISGLGDHHIRLDIGTFISQLQKSKYLSHSGATHPSMIIRSRALLWFSLENMPKSRVSAERILEVDKRILRDFDKYVDKFFNHKKNELIKDLYMWMAVQKIVEDGLFDKNEQIQFIDVFGKESFDKLINFLSHMSSSEANDTISQKVIDSKTQLEHFSPSLLNNELEKIQDKLGSHFT